MTLSAPDALDLRDIRCEVGDLQQRMLLVADDLDCRGAWPTASTRAVVRTDSPNGIVLVDEIELLDALLVLHVVRERFHLDVGVSHSPAEVPEAALVVGEHRIDRSVVKNRTSLPGLRHCTW